MPAIRNGRTFVPVRYVSEALGAEVFWDGGTRSVTVTYTEWPMPYTARHDSHFDPYIPLPWDEIDYEDEFLGYTCTRSRCILKSGIYKASPCTEF